MRGCGNFFCDNQDCERKIFAEQLAPWVAKYGRRTQRLNAFLVELTALSGGNGSARLAGNMGYHWSSDTLLRELMTAEIDQPAHSGIIGVDDFAFRKGQSYGTILVDLLDHRVIDLLPDRRQETLRHWLEQQPRVRIISRDRAGSYAKAAASGAPQALQVADRWHLMKNYSDAVVRFLNLKTNLLRQARDHQRRHDKDVFLEPHRISERKTAKKIAPRRTRSQSERNRKAKWRRICALHQQGMSSRAIAHRLGISRNTVRKYVAGDAPYLQQKRNVPSAINPFLPYLRQQWEQGVNNAAQLWRQIQQRGYEGSQSNIRQFLARWRKYPPHTAGVVSQTETQGPGMGHCPSPWRIARLMTQQPAHLARKDHRFLETFYQWCPSARIVAKRGRQFHALLRERRADLLDQWLKQVNASGIQTLKNFARGIQRDKQAVEGAMSTDWSNGQTEGQVNRLKLVKRDMFGRASFELLRKRILMTTKPKP